MNRIDITEDPRLKEFFDKKPRRKSTRKKYISLLRNYTKFIADYKIKSYKEKGIRISDNYTVLNVISYLIDESNKEQDDQVRMKYQSIDKYLTLYAAYMTDKYKANSVRVKMADLKSFYKAFKIDRPEIDLNLENDDKFVTYDDLLQKDDLKRIYNHCNIKYKAIFLLIISSGMAAEEIRNLMYKDLLKSLGLNRFVTVDKLEEKVKNIETAGWKIKRKKVSREYITFSTPESIEAIIEYLKLIDKGDYPVNSEDYIIFNHKGRKMCETSIWKYFNNINQKLDLGKFNDHYRLHPHGLRELMASNTAKAGADEKTTGQFLGHKVKTTTGRYIKPDIDVLKEKYLGLMHHLCLNDVREAVVVDDELKERLAAVEQFMFDMIEHPELMELYRKVQTQKIS